MRGVDIEPMENGNKKYKAIIDKKVWNKEHPNDKVDKDKVIYFGAKGYQQYEDKFGYYSDKNHYDEKRRQNYQNRHGKIKRKDGTLAYKYKYSPAWFSYNYLW